MNVKLTTYTGRIIEYDNIKEIVYKRTEKETLFGKLIVREGEA